MTSSVMCQARVATRVRACNYIKVETGRNFLPVLKIVTRTAQAVAMRAFDQSSIFSTGGKFHSDYGLLLELHVLTLVARSYALLTRNIIEDSRSLARLFLLSMYEQSTNHACINYIWVDNK